MMGVIIVSVATWLFCRFFLASTTVCPAVIISKIGIVLDTMSVRSLLFAMEGTACDLSVP